MLKASGNKLNCIQRLAILFVLGVCVSPVFGQDSTDVDHSAVLELGGAGERDLKGNSSNFGATLAIEMTPVENWLELEFGVTVLGTSGHTELATDLLFKKPYRLSPTAEFMFGVGLEMLRKFSVEERATSFGVEAVLDFMFWPADNIGWYLEPGFDLEPYYFVRGHLAIRLRSHNSNYTPRYNHCLRLDILLSIVSPQSDSKSITPLAS